MSDGINRVTLLGNLGADPELRQTQGGVVLNLRLATTESYLDRDKVRQERTDWHSVTLWGKRGEALAGILRKGSQLLVEGRLSTSSYEKDRAALAAHTARREWATYAPPACVPIPGRGLSCYRRMTCPPDTPASLKTAPRRSETTPFAAPAG